MLDCKIACSSMNLNKKLKVNDDIGTLNSKLYRCMVGGLKYLSHMRPNIAYFMSLVSRFMNNPTRYHLGAIKQIIWYVVSTIDFGIWYSKVSSFKLFSFTNNDWASCINDKNKHF